MYNKTIITYAFCDIYNNQGLRKGYQPKPSAAADNPYLDLDYSGYHKNLIQITRNHSGNIWQEIFKIGLKVFSGAQNTTFFQDVSNRPRNPARSGCEIVWSQCQLAGVRNVKSIYFGSYYRPNKSDLVSIEELNVSLLKMGTTLHKNNVILAGDFNAPDVDWTSPLDSDKLSFASKKLLEVFDDHDLNQFVKEPTRRQGDSQHILDLVLSNNKDIIGKVKVIDGISDHDIVLFNVRASCQRKRNVKRKVYIKKKADCQRIKRELQSLAETQAPDTDDASVDEKWNYFEENIRRIMDTCIPHKMTSSRYNLPWFDRSLRRQTRAKQRLYNKAKKSRNPAHWSEYRAARKRTQKNLKSAREVYISDFLGDAIEENPKRFWSYIKQLKNDDPGVADFNIDNRIISDGKAKSELLSEQFSSVFTVEDLTDIPVAGRDPKPGISGLTVTIPGVIKQLQSLKPNKASGPDGIPPWFLKEYAAEIGPMLAAIYQASVDSGRVPSKWKHANVCSVYKNGGKSNPANYRPISLTCIASKVLEHIIHSHIMKHLEQYSILTDVQHGFRAKRSTGTQLILTIHDMAKTIQDNKSVHAAVLDFSKAFDKVPHKRLIIKLQYYGIRGPLLNWFESFLTNRSQTVVCDGKHSDPAQVTSGVPQGTVLGPLLFLLYVNDLPDNLKSSIRLFADDALLYGVISNENDGDQLQEDLKQLEAWQNTWQMSFNPSKCKTICISTKRDPPQKKYVFCGVELEKVDSISYLGVILNDNLKWSKHVQSTTGKASKVLGMMKRNLWNCPKRVRETAYTAIVRPKLEYASSAWDPYHQKDIDSLERVQRKAARFCCNNYQPTASVTAMIQDLGWKTLESRRTMTRLTLLYKMSRGEIDIDTDSFLRPHAESRTRASHSYRYRQDKATKNLYFYSFFPRTLRQWNNLPADIVESNSLSQFQSKLSDHLSHV